MKRFAVIFTALAVLLTGCPKPTPQPDPGVKPPTAAEKQEVVGKRLLSEIKLLTPKHVAELEKHAQKLVKQEERQASARRWLIAGAIALLLSGSIALAGKLLGGLSLAGSWWGAVLAWAGRQCRWRDVIAGLVFGGLCAAGAYWIDALWSCMRDSGWLLLLSAGAFGVWELAARYYTGTWDTVGDGVKPGRR